MTHLYSTKNKKREGPYQLLVLLVEVFALPGLTERATQKPHAEYDSNDCTKSPHGSRADIVHTYSKGIYLPSNS